MSTMEQTGVSYERRGWVDSGRKTGVRRPALTVAATIDLPQELWIERRLAEGPHVYPRISNSSWLRPRNQLH